MTGLFKRVFEKSDRISIIAVLLMLIPIVPVTAQSGGTDTGFASSNPNRSPSAPNAPYLANGYPAGYSAYPAGYSNPNTATVSTANVTSVPTTGYPVNQTAYPTGYSNPNTATVSTANVTSVPTTGYPVNQTAYPAGYSNPNTAAVSTANVTSVPTTGYPVNQTAYPTGYSNPTAPVASYPINSVNNSMTNPTAQSSNSRAGGMESAEQAVSDMKKRVSAAEYNPNVPAPRVYHEGAETLGRVGQQAILKRDIIHQLRKFAQLHWLQEIEKMPEEERKKNGEKIRQELIKGYLSNEKAFSDALDTYIRKLLYYNDFIVSRPKEQVEEQRKKLSELFETEYLPEMCKRFNCKDIPELKEYFKTQLDSTLAEEKHLFIQETIGSSWLEFNLGTEVDNPNVVDLRRFYETHLDLYKQEERVRWLSLTVSFSRHSTEQEAYEKIARLGNYILEATTKSEQNRRFQEIARKESEDFFASKGGVHEWTKKGVLNSKIVENALFSDELPVGQLSKIIKDSNGFTIICVLQREGKTWKPFIEIQEEVKKKYVEDKRNALQEQYEEALSKRFTIELYNINEQERRNRVQNLFKESKSASGRLDTELQLH